MRRSRRVGLPAIIRPSFTLGGTGGGIAYNRDEFEAIVRGGLEASPTTEVLIEESVLGWKEYEMEVVRDRADNAIIICSIENIDPMGVHTGDIITVAPALTLTDKEYQRMRSASIAVLREIGVETGGSNVQFAVDPKTGRMVVIEMNPRVSRSSALASKATGFPIAKVAARLAVGYTLDEIANDITGGATPASFEPTIDYVVTKIPRFAFEKFKGAEALLSTSMKSVGEVMAIGRNFAESLQKALRGLETGLTGLDRVRELENADPAAIESALARPTPDRLLVAAEALRQGFTVERINEIAGFDPWFLKRLEEIVRAEEEVRVERPAERRARDAAAEGDGLFRRPAGAARASLGACRARDERSGRGGRLGRGPQRDPGDDRRGHRRRGARAPAAARRAAGVQADRQLRGRVRCGDALSVLDLRGAALRRAGGRGRGVGPAQGDDPRRRAEPDRAGHRVRLLLLPRRLRARRDRDGQAGAGFEVIMVNCNPETVSTDPDTSDRLYFEPLTAEDVLEIVRREQEKGELLGRDRPARRPDAAQARGGAAGGGRSDPRHLARQHRSCRGPRAVRGAGRSSSNLKQPANGIARSRDEALRVAERIGYPVLLRPSYVLGGRGMEVVDGPQQLEHYIATAVQVSGRSPVLIDRYLRDAIEVDVDAICDGTDVAVCGVLQHIEEAGVHSGDSACSIPPHSLEPRSWSPRSSGRPARLRWRSRSGG